MRLICPNCGAQYEVDAAMIPAGGRDVQCSNCGNTWFQRPAEDDKDLAEELGRPEAAPQDAIEDDWTEDDHGTADAGSGTEQDVRSGPNEGEVSRGSDASQDLRGPANTEADGIADGGEGRPIADGDATDPEAAAVHARGPEPAFAPDDKPDPKPADATEVAPAFVATEGRQQRRPIDPEIAEILREEAEREAMARAAEANAELESQPELALDDGEDDRTRAVRARTARLRGDAPDAPPNSALGGAPSGERNGEITEGTSLDGLDAVPAPPSNGGRRARLPDIDEINSTLTQPKPERDGAAPPNPGPEDPEARERAYRGGFRVGFSLIILVVGLALILYAFAAPIAAAIPATEPYLFRYVEAANASRVLVNTQLESLLLKLQELTASIGAAAP